jgi:hypothetical protein
VRIVAPHTRLRPHDAHRLRKLALRNRAVGKPSP